MRMRAVQLVVALSIGLAIALAMAASPTNIGSEKCKMCHKDQFGVWEKSKHAKAWAALKPEEQKKDCATCHQTAANMPNVGCENCHGAGSDYKGTMVNKAKWTSDKAGQLKLAQAAGLVDKPTEAVCTKCHNKKSPNFKSFNFNEAKAKIKHWK